MISQLFPPKQTLQISLLLLISGTCMSALVPVMGYFMIDELGESAWTVGIYNGLVTAITFALNRWTGGQFDKGAIVLRLLLAAGGAYCAAALMLIVAHGLTILLVVVAPLMGIASTGMSTTFAFGRVAAERARVPVARANSWLRAAISLAWMIGPALSFTLIGAYGFGPAFAASAVLGVVWLALLVWFVPADFRADQHRKSNTQANDINWGLMLAALICLMFVLVTALFESAMPMYFIQDVHLPAYAPGLHLSIKCFLELFTIFSSSALVDRIGIRRVLIGAALIAVTTMVLYAEISSLAELIAVSALDGIYYGLFAGVAVTYCQSFEPDRPGRATAVYANSYAAGNMVGSMAMGFIASATSFRSVIFVAAYAAWAVAGVLALEVPLRQRARQSAR
ncbi:MFS transporter [Methylovirgula sp. 4M-Z18]|uniref:MFS transporter n=1 Tax=Methylovirgula sp. 4M-Z18 TaxID=2293567 RepID=UPI000E2E520B|nr:MFS transporter [Methylovirgula sp. 4M-Z18]RFB80332.1 MFS transporter [Methylovirgula sp. 4M-Z18]